MHSNLQFKIKDYMTTLQTGLNPILKNISQQFKINFIIEKSPMPFLSASKLPTFNNKLINLKNSEDINSYINTLSEIFGLKSVRVENWYILCNNYLLTDNPLIISKAELSQFLLNIGRIASSYSNNVNMPFSIYSFFQSLSQEDKQQASIAFLPSEDNKKTDSGIPFSRLDINQKFLIKQICENRYIGYSSPFFGRGINCINDICKDSTEFYWSNIGGYTHVLTTEYQGPNNKHLFALSPTSRIYYDFASCGLSTPTEPPPALVHDEYDPTPDDIQNPLLTSPMDQSISLRDLLDKKVATTEKPIIFSDSEMRNETITIISNDSIDQAIFFTAIKTIFNWSISKTSEHIKISYPKILTNQPKIQNIPDLINQIFPSRLKRLCESCSEIGISQNITKIEDLYQRNNEPIPNNVATKLHTQSQTLTSIGINIYKKKLIKYFRSISEEIINKNSSHTLITQLPHEASHTLALVVSMDALPYAYFLLSQNAPWYITDVNESYVSGTVTYNGNEVRCQFRLSSKNKTLPSLEYNSIYQIPK